MVKIKYKKLDPESIQPTQITKGDSGWDVRTATRLIINPYKTVRAGTGLAVDLPKGYEIQVRGKTSVALEKGLTISQGVGTISQGYIGEIQIYLRNMEPFTKVIEIGEPIAQLVVKEVLEVEWIEAPKMKKPEKRNEPAVKKEEPKEEPKVEEIKEKPKVKEKIVEV